MCNTVWHPAFSLRRRRAQRHSQAMPYVAQYDPFVFSQGGAPRWRGAHSGCSAVRGRWPHWEAHEGPRGGPLPGLYDQTPAGRLLPRTVVRTAEARVEGRWPWLTTYAVVHFPVVTSTLSGLVKR
jgi:hypothetical protein